MWVFLNDAFLSIVDPVTPKKRRKIARGTGPRDMLLVRARLPGDIERTFPNHKVRETRERDYRFRAMIPRSVVEARMAAAVRDIDYSNFKASVRDHERHDAYMDVWSAMMRAQKRAMAKPADDEPAGDDQLFDGYFSRPAGRPR